MNKPVNTLFFQDQIVWECIIQARLWNKEESLYHSFLYPFIQARLWNKEESLYHSFLYPFIQVQQWNKEESLYHSFLYSAWSRMQNIAHKGGLTIRPTKRIIVKTACT